MFRRGAVVGSLAPCHIKDPGNETTPAAEPWPEYKPPPRCGRRGLFKMSSPEPSLSPATCYHWLFEPFCSGAHLRLTDEQPSFGCGPTAAGRSGIATSSTKTGLKRADLGGKKHVKSNT